MTPPRAFLTFGREAVRSVGIVWLLLSAVPGAAFTAMSVYWMWVDLGPAVARLYRLQGLLATSPGIAGAAAALFAGLALTYAMTIHEYSGAPDRFRTDRLAARWSTAGGLTIATLVFSVCGWFLEEGMPLAARTAWAAFILGSSSQVEIAPQAALIDHTILFGSWSAWIPPTLSLAAGVWFAFAAYRSTHPTPGPATQLDPSISSLRRA